ncbi:hypothetical protein [Parasitella parasitica]|uniref:Core-binding (CB) domain-containing protein n=1 Tax=Parasitella parasitica TaxID=35722 RepID=A0A0B7MXA4_9FUNG|nr:hypothetical protein [Parasitella parasitica]
MSSINGLTDEKIQKLLEFYEQCQGNTNEDFDRSQLCSLPAEILSELEETAPSELKKKEPSTVSSSLSSRSKGWTPPSRSMLSTKEPIVQKLQRLAVYSFATGKELDEDAKDLATRIIRLPENMQYLRDNEEDDKDMAFPTEIVEKIHQGRYEEAILKQATSRTYGGFKPRGDYKGNSRGGFSRGGRGGKGRGRGHPPPSTSTQHHHLSNSTTDQKYKQTNNDDQQHALHNSRRWDSTRRTSTTLHQQLAEDNDPQMALVCNKSRIPNPIPVPSYPMEAEDTIPEPGIGPYSGEISRVQSHRTSTGSGQPLSVDSIHDSRAKQDSANLGLQANQQTYPGPTLQDGGCPCVTPTDRARRLCSQDRLEGCLRSGAYPPAIEEVLVIRTQRYCVPLFILSVWDEFLPSCLRKIDSVCLRIASPEGHQNGKLLGRHVHPGQDKGRMSVACGASSETPTGFGVHHQLRKEQSERKSCPRLLGFHVQHQEDEDQRAAEEDEQSILSHQTAPELKQDALMSLDCRDLARSLRRLQFDWEGECVLSQHANDDLTWWEQVSSAKNGLPLREDHIHTPPAITIHCDASDSGWGVASGHVTTAGFWSTAESEDSINVRELKTVKFALLLHARKFAGQSLQLFTDNTTAVKYAMKSGGTASIALQSLALDINEIINKFNLKVKFQHIAGQENTRADALSRRKKPLGALGTTTDRCLRIQGEPQNEGVLELPAGPRSNSNRCLPAELAEEGAVSPPSVAIDSQGDTQAAEGQGQQGRPSHPELAQPVLVANGSESEQVIPIKARSIKEVDLDRLAIIREYQDDEINEEVSEYLHSANSTGTHKQYDGLWKQWASWCHGKQWNPREYNPPRIVEYLLSRNQDAYSTLNSARSAIASVFKVIHPNKAAIASHQLMIDFFSAKKRKSPKLSNHDQETFDISLITNHILAWGTTESLSLSQLQQKALYLLTVSTMWRPRSDIGTLQFRDLEFIIKDSVLNGLTIISRAPKEITPKKSKLGVIEDTDICPVKTLFEFVTRSRTLRCDLPEDHTLFLANIDDGNSCRSIRPSTAATWLTTLMKASGVDTNVFKAHSLRSAASTKAVQRGVPIQTVKEHANWSLSANTFEKYYYKPSGQHARGSFITEQLFDDTENRTTSEVGVEATSIVLGTTHNGTVAETKTEDVVGSRRKKLWKFLSFQ